MNFIKGKQTGEEKKEEMTTYSLTQEEKAFLSQRTMLMNQHVYLSQLIENEMQDYVDSVIRKRLNLPLDVVPYIDEVKGELRVPKKKASQSSSVDKA